MKKVVSFDQIEREINGLRKTRDIKIVFTNGCFDILHRGHVEYLEDARELGDFMVLGLNSDQSVTRLKGSPRPYTSEEDRAYILSRLKSVDIVCIFEQDTPYELIDRVRPDVLVKGGDYIVEDIVGRQIVEKNGGQVITIPYIEGKSSTSIIDRIKNE